MRERKTLEGREKARKKERYTYREIYREIERKMKLLRIEGKGKKEREQKENLIAREGMR